MKNLIAPLLIFISITACKQEKNDFTKNWSNLDERVWVGKEFWSNRLQDWKIQKGRLECLAADTTLPMRTTHFVNYRLDSTVGSFYAKMNFGKLQPNQNSDAACGFLIGAGAEIDVLGASLIQQNTGPGGGLFAGVSSDGKIFVKDMETGKVLNALASLNLENTAFEVFITNKDTSLSIMLKKDGAELIINNISSKRLIGNIALVSHPGKGKYPGSFWFNDIQIKGDKLIETDVTIGPVVGSQYTLSNNTLKLTAQLVPIAKTDPELVFLEIKKDDHWKEIDSTKIITPGYTATFKINNWNSKSDIPYRIKYSYNSTEKKSDIAYRTGIIRKEPVDKEEIIIAGFTGNHNIAHPGLSKLNVQYNFDFRGIWYPHKDIVSNIKIHNPDVLFFSGDQVYETNSPTKEDLGNLELDYLYKWYLYYLAYGELTKDIPTVSIPDDHDVYQGNLWGQGGRYTDKDDKGGYVYPAWFVKMVERTQCSNLPDPYDPTPIEQGIGVYYTSMNYGGIGFAIIEDRKFKSGCSDNPFKTRGRADHINDPDFDVKQIDLPGKKLLGERQLNFLNDWSTNWENHEMKIVLSQTIFANMATHHGNMFKLIADLDSDGWPQTGRNKAVDALRKGFAFHLAGDQHLGSFVHHGIDEWGDAMYSFCVPSIANFYPRAWWPENPGIDVPKGKTQNMGKHKDGFGNLVTVYAVTNPTDFTKVSTQQEPLELHDKAPGYGIVIFNKKNRTITAECWPRYADANDPTQQYEGWPITINQMDNYGREPFAYLPTLIIKGSIDPVVEIRDENDELVYCIRIKGNKFRPKVFSQGNFTIIVRDSQKNTSKKLSKVKPISKENEELNIEL